MAVEVAILGGGIGGLSAAHHLRSIGVPDVHVFESSTTLGGKAKNQYLPDGAPGEHGFRFFPHFYRHVVDTMRAIPAPKGSAWDHLAESTHGGIAYDGRLYTVDRPVRLDQPGKFITSIVRLLGADELNNPQDLSRFAAVMLKFATSCDERRREQYDNMTWEEFTGGPGRYQPAFYAIVIQATRNLAAMRAQSSSAATIGSMCLQMIFDFEPSHEHKVDGVLDGPTDEAWLRPWRDHLLAKGVQFHCDTRVTGFDFAPPMIRGVRLQSGEVVKARRYVCAVPLERMAELVTAEMRAFDPALEGVVRLAPIARGDMAGAQYFLRRDVPILRGHIHFPRAPFGLTAVSPLQFWSSKPVAGLISVIISDWDRKNAHGRRARDYTDRTELLREVWAQLLANLPPGTLSDDDLVAMHLDENVALAPFANTTPLLIHPRGQRALRPQAKNRIANLYLAADYVRTHTDLASMEGADEAARRAVRAMFADMERPDLSPPPEVWPLSEGEYFAGAKVIDAMLWRLGLPHPMEWSLAQVVDVGRALDGVSATEVYRDAVRFGSDVLQALTATGAEPDLDDPDLGILKEWEHAFSRRRP